MRRLIVLSAVPVALLALGSGCRVTTGVCDCGEYPGEAARVGQGQVNYVPAAQQSSYEMIPAPKGARPLPGGVMPSEGSMMPKVGQ